MKKVIEVVVYKVKEGVEVEQLKEARKKMDEILPQYNGFISLLRFSDLKEIFFGQYFFFSKSDL